MVGKLNHLVIAGEQKDIAWFKEHGYDGEVLYQSAWGMTCPLRIEDINDMLSEAVYVNNNPKHKGKYYNGIVFVLIGLILIGYELFEYYNR